MNYEIIASLGPASAAPETWRAMTAAGASSFRLNTSHLDAAQLDGWLEGLEAFCTHEQPHMRVILDLQGSKWRLGAFAPFTLQPGQEVMLTRGAESAESGCLPVPHADFFAAAAQSDGRVVLNDARIVLEVLSAEPECVRARVVVGGEIVPRKGITLGGASQRVEQLGDRDRAVVERTRNLPWVGYAVSYVKDAAEMRRYRQIFDPQAQLIAKLERRSAVEGAADIASATDGLWLCRGDLGAELGLRGMAEAAWEFAQEVRILPVPAALAGQVLEHMTAHAEPTRSEITTIYAALAQGYRGLVLSDETAVGAHPVESVRTAALFRQEAE